MDTSRSHPGRSAVPTTPSGRLGTWLTLLGTALFIGVLAFDALRDTPDPAVFRFLLPIAWVAILAGGTIIVASILRERERGLLAYVALVPFSLIVLAFLAELTGLME